MLKHSQVKFEQLAINFQPLNVNTTWQISHAWFNFEMFGKCKQFTHRSWSRLPARRIMPTVITWNKFDLIAYQTLADRKKLWSLQMYDPSSSSEDDKEDLKNCFHSTKKFIIRYVIPVRTFPSSLIVY